MPAVLFVDDEPNILQGLRRMLRGRAAVWQMSFAASGREALEIMARMPADLIVSDMRMPGMDGAELLAQVKQRWPGTARIVLSGHSDHEAILRAVHEAHQYLTKPCEAGALEQAIERSLRLRLLLADPELIGMVAGIDCLPTLPEVYRSITAALRDKHMSIRDVGSLIEADLGLTAKILQVVNSAFFGLPRHVGSAADAAVYLGLDVLTGLVLGLEQFPVDDGDPRIVRELQEIRHRAIRVATKSKRIAADLGCAAHAVEQSFLAGMLHELGRLVLIRQAPARYLDDGTERNQADQALIGAYLLGLWGFSDEVVEAVAFQRTPSAALPPSVRPLTAVHLAVCLCGREAVPPDAHLLESLRLAERVPAWRAPVEQPGTA